MAARSRGLEDVLHFFIPEDEQRRARASRRLASSGRDGSKSRKGAFSGGCYVLAADPRRPLAAALAVDLITALGAPGAGRKILSVEPPPIPWRDSGAVPWRQVLTPGAARSALAREPEDRTCLLALAPRELSEWLPALGPPDCVDGLLLAIEAGERSFETLRSVLSEVSRRVANLAPVRWIGAIAMGAADPEIGQQSLHRAAELTRSILGRELRQLGGFPHDRATNRSLLRGQPIFEVDANSASARCLRQIALELETGVERPG